MSKIEWHKEEPTVWVGNWRYWIKYENNKFVASAFDEGIETSYKLCNTLKQAKAWCERKERKRLKETTINGEVTAYFYDEKLLKSIQQGEKDNLQNMLKIVDDAVKREALRLTNIGVGKDCVYPSYEDALEVAKLTYGVKQNDK